LNFYCKVDLLNHGGETKKGLTNAQDTENNNNYWYFVNAQGDVPDGWSSVGKPLDSEPEFVSEHHHHSGESMLLESFLR
jgi:hypothetical protein